MHINEGVKEVGNTKRRSQINIYIALKISDDNTLWDQQCGIQMNIVLKYTHGFRIMMESKNDANKNEGKQGMNIRWNG